MPAATTFSHGLRSECTNLPELLPFRYHQGLNASAPVVLAALAEAWPTETVRNSPFLKLAQKIPPPRPPEEGEARLRRPHKSQKQLGRMRLAPLIDKFY